MNFTLTSPTVENAGGKKKGDRFAEHLLCLEDLLPPTCSGIEPKERVGHIPGLSVAWWRL